MKKSADHQPVKGLFVARTIPLGLVVAAAVLLYLWVGGDAASELAVRLPDPNNVRQAFSGEDVVADLRGELIESNGVPADLPGAWPRFRGANYDAISTEDVELAR